MLMRARQAEVLDDCLRLAGEGSVDGQGSCRIRFGHLEVMFCSVSYHMQQSGQGSPTQKIDGALVHDMEQHQQIHGK